MPRQTIDPYLEMVGIADGPSSRLLVLQMIESYLEMVGTTEIFKPYLEIVGTTTSWKWLILHGHCWALLGDGL